MFSKLQTVIVNLGLENKPQNIFNCDETGFQTDAGSQKVLCRRGSRNPHKLVANVTKALYTVLVCCNAVGDYTLFFVNYKGLHLYSNWCQGGPENARYNCSPSGWMESNQFLDWFQKILISEGQKLEGKKLLIYDGHSSHLSLPLIDMAIQNGIELFCLPAHTSHLLQPLDVAVYKGVKQGWRIVLQEYYQKTNYKSVDKPSFPSLLKQLVDKGCFSRANAISGFEASGIFPLKKEKVLEKISTASAFSHPDQCVSFPEVASTNNSCSREDGTNSNKTPQQHTPKKALELALLSVLQSQNDKKDNNKRTRVKRTLAESLTETEVLNRLASLEQRKKQKKSKSKNTKRRLFVDVESSSSEDEPVPLQDESDDLVFSEDEAETSDKEEQASNSAITKGKRVPGKGDWVLVQFVVKKNTPVVHYVGEIINIEKETATVNFLRKQKKAFTFLPIRDEAKVLINDCVMILPKPNVRRGLHDFKVPIPEHLTVY